MDVPPSESLSRDDLLALLSASESLKEPRSLRDVLRRILELAGRLTDSAAGSVMLHDPERDDLYFAAATGPAAEQLEYVRVPVTKGKAGQVFRTGQPVVENTLTDHYRLVDEKTSFQTQSMICVPLFQGTRTFGVMQLLNKAEGQAGYTARDVELLTRFGVQATLSIRNAELFEQMLGSSGLHAHPTVRQDIVDRLLLTEPLAMQECLTILAGDMRGFSRLCAGVGKPGRIQQMLSEYIAMLASIVVHHGGVLNKVIGDGIVALFRHKTAPQRAVRAAFDMVERFVPLRDNWRDRVNIDLGFLGLGIGIATDEDMILGEVGDSHFRDVTVIGDAVNLASILVDQARHGRHVLCDRLTWLAVRTSGIAAASDPVSLNDPKLLTLSGASYQVYELTRPDALEPARRPASARAEEEFDVFISYRRQGASAEARLIQQALLGDFRVFLDVDRMPSGRFDESLLRIIERTANFVVILSKGSLDRAHAPTDWLRREIVHALTKGVNVVPVTLPDFQFPHAQELPEEIRDLVRHDAVAYSHVYFYPAIDKLKDHLRPRAIGDRSPGDR